MTRPPGAEVAQGPNPGQDGPLTELQRPLPPGAFPTGRGVFWLNPLLWSLVGALAGLVAAIGWVHLSSYQSTDDAFLEGHIIRVAPRVAGHVRRCYVLDNQEVHKGDLLVELDPDLYAAGLQAAQAQSQEAFWELQRMEAMRKSSSVSEFDLQKARAKALSMAALEETARLQLSYTRILAPTDGRVTKKTVEEGNYVRVGDTLFSLVPKEVWVVANFKESQLAWMRPGQPVEIRVDAYPQKRWKGHVDSVQRGSGARFSLLPPENATGNYVKVVQRVPVKIVFDEPLVGPYELGPGMSAVPRVKVREDQLSFRDGAIGVSLGALSGGAAAILIAFRRRKRASAAP
jgi:membrane fusion protein (multidrug efflux system)